MGVINQQSRVKAGLLGLLAFLPLACGSGGDVASGSGSSGGGTAGVASSAGSSTGGTGTAASGTSAGATTAASTSSTTTTGTVAGTTGTSVGLVSVGGGSAGAGSSSTTTTAGSGSTTTTSGSGTTGTTTSGTGGSATTTAGGTSGGTTIGTTGEIIRQCVIGQSSNIFVVNQTADGQDVSSLVATSRVTLPVSQSITSLALSGVAQEYAFASGFGGGQGQGRVGLVTYDGVATALASSNGVSVTNPFTVIGLDLSGANAQSANGWAVTAGFGLGVGNGRVFNIPPASINRLAGTASYVDISQGGSLQNPLGLVAATNRRLFVTEYLPSGQGSVKEINYTPGGAATMRTVVSGLSNPAGIATDGQTVVVCENLASGQGGRVLAFPLDPAGALPLTPSSPEVQPVPIANGSGFNFPWEIKRAPLGGFVVSEGLRLDLTGGTPTLTGAANQGGLRFIPAGLAQSAYVVLSSRGPISGFTIRENLDGLGTGGYVVAFSEALSQGRISQVRFSLGGPPVNLFSHLTFASGISQPFAPLYIPARTASECTSLRVGLLGGGILNIQGR